MIFLIDDFGARKTSYGGGGLGRPYRADACFTLFSQGVALGLGWDAPLGRGDGTYMTNKTYGARGLVVERCGLCG